MQLRDLLGTSAGRLLSAVVLALTGFLWLGGTAQAVPVLQVGAPAGPGDTGTYADYGNGSDPTEEDTAFTSGNTIYVSGLYQNDKVLNLGGQSGSGLDWTGVDGTLPTAFNGHDAILVVSVPDGSLALALASLTVNGIFAFHSSEDTSYFPNNHDPVKDSVADFLFFDIGEFSKSVAIPDFDDESAGSKLGQIKTLILAGFEGLDWLHFDVMAIETTQQNASRIVTSIANNPGSHDVTWKPDDEGPGPDPDIDVPEPASMLLLGSGMIGLALLRRRFQAGRPRL